MNPYVRGFFNLTAGLEKFIIAVLAAVQAYVGTLPEPATAGGDGWTPAQKALAIALLAAVQMLYTTNTAKVPPTPEAGTNPTTVDPNG